jgi:DNA replication protein DnaC
MARCPHDACDGSGFLYDEAARTAYPCRCRPQRIARRKAAAVAGRIPKRYRDVSFDRQPVLSMPADAVKAVRAYCERLDQRLEEGRGMYFQGDVGTGKTTMAMLIARTAMEAGHTVAIYSLPRLLGLLRDTYDDASEFSLNGLLDRLAAVDLLHVDDVGLGAQIGARTVSRLFEMCELVRMYGDDQRGDPGILSYPKPYGAAA